MRFSSTIIRIVVSGALLVAGAPAQQDPLQELNKAIRSETKRVFGFTFEERTRWEEKDGVNFGKSVDQQDMLSRLRIGADFTPVKWFTISAMGQDVRAPFYGAGAPNTLRDSMDLHEGYVRLLGDRKTGFGGEFGREMLNFGEGRLIGTPQWSNVSRTYDTGRLYYRTAKTRLEVLMVSPVKVLSDKFNVPDLGERIWGMYDTFGSVWRGLSVDVYALRHSQNKIGGWTGAGTLGTNTFGGRGYGPLPGKFTYSVEGVGQTGHLGLLDQRAWAGFANISHQTTLFGKPLGMSAEYKLASGTGKGQTDSSTFDQLAAANHDKFGHMDLFGWRNLRTFKSLESLNVAKTLVLNVMYTDHWLDSAYDSLYNSSGAVISTSKTGSAGTGVGQELDAFVTYQRGAHLFGVGFGHFFKGEFVQQTTKDINPRYFYVFQQYSFR